MTLFWITNFCCFHLNATHLKGEKKKVTITVLEKTIFTLNSVSRQASDYQNSTLKFQTGITYIITGLTSIK